jgi:hypothetical protein
MDIERAIEHILDLQARAEVRMDRAEARMDRTDRQIRGIQKLIQTGMKLIVKTQKAGKDSETRLDAKLKEAETRLDAKLAELADAQLKTDRKFDKLIDLWTKRPPNGRR